MEPSCVGTLLVTVLKGEGVRSESRIHTFFVGTCWGQELEGTARGSQLSQTAAREGENRLS